MPNVIAGALSLFIVATPASVPAQSHVVPQQQPSATQRMNRAAAAEARPAAQAGVPRPAVAQQEYTITAASPDQRYANVSAELEQHNKLLQKIDKAMDRVEQNTEKDYISDFAKDYVKEILINLLPLPEKSHVPPAVPIGVTAAGPVLALFRVSTRRSVPWKTFANGLIGVYAFGLFSLYATITVAYYFGHRTAATATSPVAAAAAPVVQIVAPPADWRGQIENVRRDQANVMAAVHGIPDVVNKAFDSHAGGFGRFVIGFFLVANTILLLLIAGKLGAFDRLLN